MLMQLIAVFLLVFEVGRTAMVSDLLSAIATILAAATVVISGGKFSGKNRYAQTVVGGYIIAAGAVMILAQGLL